MGPRLKNVFAATGVVAVVTGLLGSVAVWVLFPGAAYYARVGYERLAARVGMARHELLPHGGDYREAGKTLYEAECANCHGIGAGGGRGPSLFDTTLLQSKSDFEMLQTVKNGVPNTEMPAYRVWMSDADVLRILAYVRSQGEPGSSRLTGDPANGAALVRARGCLACHSIGREGVGFGPDLSGVGLRRGSAYLRRKLLDPTADVPVRYRPVYASAGGRTIKGYAMSEDTFWIQLLDADGTVHSLRKDELTELRVATDESWMRSYRTAFDDSQVDDVVAYLASLREVR